MHWRMASSSASIGGSPSPLCRFANVIKAFAHCRRLRAHQCRVVWVEPIIIQLRLNGTTRALVAISNVCAHVPGAHDDAEKLPPCLFFLIPTVVVGTIIIMVVVVASKFL